VTDRTQRSTEALQCGDRGGRGPRVTPAAAMFYGKTGPYCPSQSCRSDCPTDKHPDASIVRWRATCIIHWT